MTVPTPETQAPHVSFERERGVYAIHVTSDLAHAVVEVGRDVSRNSRILLVFRTLADADVPVFLIKMHVSAVTLALAGADVERAEAALAAGGMHATIRRELALVAVRAASMRDLSGVMAHIADALSRASARLLETGDSHNSVLCLIPAERAGQAVLELCASFDLDADAVSEDSAVGESA